ncbi:hypothetical protein HPB47_001383 [Ixodes persulcatus]|uniref:Uncharacterized protein n=1 Tax=Ixodes persulcatus TaxID=34615 RepID=A0AC60PP71_IXOPE|nr:hypothetical protein HPB47_001383 [Ixodes persulcatus]
MTEKFGGCHPVDFLLVRRREETAKFLCTWKEEWSHTAVPHLALKVTASERAKMTSSELHDANTPPGEFCAPFWKPGALAFGKRVVRSHAPASEHRNREVAPGARPSRKPFREDGSSRSRARSAAGAGSSLLLPAWPAGCRHHAFRAYACAPSSSRTTTLFSPARRRNYAFCFRLQRIKAASIGRQASSWHVRESGGGGGPGIPRRWECPAMGRGRAALAPGGASGRGPPVGDPSSAGPRHWSQSRRGGKARADRGVGLFPELSRALTLP